jgi:hypothetical protein
MQQHSFTKKCFTCLTAGLLLAADFLLVGREGLPAWISPGLVFSLAGLSLLLLLGLSMLWHFQQDRKWTNALFPLLCSFISGLIAFNLASFGWKKIFHLQFQVPGPIADQPIGSLSGEWLTWYYFGHSPAFAYLVGGMQILGSLLLLFRKTRLAGVMVLLPVIINIMMINIFYQLNPGALLQSVVLCLGILFLLSLDFKRLTRFFFMETNSGTGYLPFSVLSKNLLRALVVILPFILVAVIKGKAGHSALPDGAYRVKNLRINNDCTRQEPCGNDSLLTKVYFDAGNTLVLQFNGYDSNLAGIYSFDPERSDLTASFDRHEKQLLRFTARADRAGNNGLAVKGKLGNDSLQFDLEKLR